MGQAAGVSINCAGGLDLVSTIQEMFQTPGAARELVNFEPAMTSGYRRINGHERWGDTQPSGGANTVYGVFPYADGVIAASNNKIYFSTDGSTWTDLCTADTPNITLINQGSCQFVHYDNGTEYGCVIYLDGENLPVFIEATGSGGGRSWDVNAITVTGSVSPKWGTVYKDRLFLTGDASTPTTLYWSEVFDPETFTAGTSGSIDFPDRLNGVVVWRDKLFGFGQKIQGLQEQPAVNTLRLVALEELSRLL